MPAPDAPSPCDAELAALEAAVELGDPLDHQSLTRWMCSPCDEVQGAVFGLLLDPPVDAVLPERRVVDDYVMTYLQARLSTPRSGRYVLSPHLAGDALRAWFQRLWAERPRDDERLAQLRDLLATLIRTGTPRARDAILLSVLVHLTVAPDVAGYFSSWQHDPDLAPVLEETQRLRS